MLTYYRLLLSNPSDAVLFCALHARYHQMTCAIALQMPARQRSADNTVFLAWGKVACLFQNAKHHLSKSDADFKAWLMKTVQGVIDGRDVEIPHEQDELDESKTHFECLVRDALLECALQDFIKQVREK